MTALNMPQAASLAETPPLTPRNLRDRADTIENRIRDIRNLLSAMDHYQQDAITAFAEVTKTSPILDACDVVASMHVVAMEALGTAERLASELAIALMPARSKSWDNAVAEWQAQKNAAQLFHETHCSKGEPLTPSVAAQADNLDKLASDLQGELMSMPAPHIAALRFKLDHLLEDDNGSLNPWTDSYVEQTRRDIARLLGEA